MIPVATISEIKALDNKVKSDDIMKSFALMQHASRVAFDLVISEILKLQKTGKESTVLILCGKGNNGGDGLLTAAYLLEQGYKVTTFLYANPDDLKGEAKLAYEYLSNVKTNPCTLIEKEEDISSLEEFLSKQARSDSHYFMLDAIYGVGYKLEAVNPLLQKTANLINNYQRAKTVIAIDCPSGVDNDTGNALQNPIRATYTLAMGFPKLGNFFFPTRAFLGMLMVANLNYEFKDVQEYLKSKLYFIDNIKNFFPGRALNGSKYDHGCVINIAGSRDMLGAAILSSKAIYKAGAGLVYTYTQEAQALLSNCPETIVKPLQDLSAQEILSNQKVDCISIGPGLGADHNELVYDLVAQSTKPLILDADAINAFVGKTDLLKKHQTEIVITPHFGEYKRLFPEDIKETFTPSSVIEAIKKRAKELDITIVLKGSPTLIADPCGEVFILPYGNSGLASAGTGDVLTGLIAGFLAQSLRRKNKYLANSKLITQNAILAVYVHAKTAELIAPEKTEYAMTASDILDNLHRSIKFSLN